MEWQAILPIAVFAMAMTGTPGPNNMMLTASGANFGYLRSIPHMFGIALGCVVMLLLIAAGLGIIFERFPMVQSVLKWVVSTYLLYLAWKIGTAPAPALDGSPSQAHIVEGKPMTLISAAAFQFVNPKAWAMTMTAIGSFTLTGDDYWLSTLMIVLTFFFVSLPCISVWAGFGTMVGKLMKTPGQWRILNTCMGLATASCLIYIW